MAYKNTIAIIGAATTSGAFIAKSIGANFRVLLMDEVPSQLISLLSTLKQVHKSVEVEIIDCCKDASWEADIIVVAKEGGQLDDLAIKIKEVTTCKPVIHFTFDDEGIDRLQHLLPNAKVVTVLLEHPLTGLNQDLHAFIHGKDEEAINIVKNIISPIGCNAKPTKLAGNSAD